MKVLIVTSCGSKKNSSPMSAYELYKSPRIRAVYNRRCNSDMCLLSAEYGLVDVYEVIQPYDRIMDSQRAEELVPHVAEKLKNYEYIVFFRGGARKEYFFCIKDACRSAAKTLVVLGYANMGGISALPEIVRLVSKRKWEQIRKIEHVEIYEPRLYKEGNIIKFKNH